MSITATTLSTAMSANDIQATVASASGISAPNFQTGSGITYLYVESELMLVTAVSGLVVSVNRGVLGTVAGSHAVSTPVLSGGDRKSVV